MFKQDSAEFAKLITGIGEIYRWEFSPQVIEIYWRVLEPFSLEDVKAAVYRHIQDPDVGKFLPKPSDIIMAIGGSSQNQALSAWSKTIYGIQTVGSYESVAFDDALIHVVVWDMGNWIKLCNSEEKQLPFIAKEFQERYRGYVRKRPHHHPSYLKGRLEMQNSIHGYDSPAPILIGNVLKAQEVITMGEDQPLFAITDERTPFISNSAQQKLNKTIPNLIPPLAIDEENHD